MSVFVRKSLKGLQKNFRIGTSRKVLLRHSFFSKESACNIFSKTSGNEEHGHLVVEAQLIVVLEMCS